MGGGVVPGGFCGPVAGWVALGLILSPAAVWAGEPESLGQQGRAILQSHCAGCHGPPGLTGEPVPLATGGTDPALGLSPVRGTGTYRVPSLHGVGTRGPLLHDGTVPSLAAFFDPARITTLPQ